jgi:hypothetical protein
VPTCRRPSGSVSWAVAEAAAKPAGLSGSSCMIARACRSVSGMAAPAVTHGGGRQRAQRLAFGCSVSTGGGGGGAGRQHPREAAGERQEGVKGRGGTGQLLRLQQSAAVGCKGHCRVAAVQERLKVHRSAAACSGPARWLQCEPVTDGRVNIACEKNAFHAQQGGHSLNLVAPHTNRIARPGLAHC